MRAQAAPYPGAFTFLNNKKIVINKIRYSSLGYVDTIPNGTIIGSDRGNPIIKTQNGAVELLQYEDFDFNIGDQLL